MKELLNLLLETASVSGYEYRLQEKLFEYMKPYVDTCEQDRIGSGTYTIQGKGGKTILLAAHIDEIGWMVSAVTKEGFLKVTKVGGISARLYPGHGVMIETKGGPVYGSVVWTSESHKKEEFEAKDLQIDIGAVTKEEALTKVRLGDLVVADVRNRELGEHRIKARGLDDKSGVCTIMEVLKKLDKGAINNTVVAAATAGEEMCKHGADWVAARLQPDEAVIVDVTYTSDYAGVESAEWGEIELGQGPAICINPICDRRMNERLMAIAEEEQIPYQIEVSGGRSYTDGDVIHVSGKGIPLTLVSIPLRYMHSPSEVADYQDIEHAIKLLAKYVSE